MKTENSHRLEKADFTTALRCCAPSAERPRQQLADAVDVNYQTIGFLERGDYGPSLKLAFAIADYFGLPIEAIFSTEAFQPLSQQVYGVRK